MTQARRRSPLPFVIAALVAVLLIVGVRLLTAGGSSLGGDGDGGEGQALPCEGDRVTLNVAASSEKAELVKQLAASYHAGSPKVAGRCVQVRVNTKASGAAMTALARDWNEAADGPRPDVWTPASSGWVALLRQRREAADKPNLVPAGDLPKIAASPLVIAMPKPMAEALGWPGRQLGWSDLLALSTSKDGWGAKGHPEWGSFKLGKTNPNYSTSGLNATVGAYFAATGRSTDLTEKDVADAKVRKFAGAVEQSVTHYGDTTLTFLSNLQRADDQGAGLSYISAVTVEEKSVWDYNQGNPTGAPGTLGQHAKPKVPLVAVYPKEGTLLSDHPWVTLAAPWVDDAKKAASADFVHYLQGADAQGQFAKFAFRDYQNKPGSLITEANGLLPKQPATLLSPPAPPVLDKTLTSWAELRKPANVLLVMDVSGSMGAEAEGTDSSKLALAQRAATNALGQFSSRDQVGLWIFSTGQDPPRDYRELVPIGPMSAQVDGQARRGALRERIGGLTPDGGTGLYDTSAAAFEFVTGRLDPAKINAVVLLTDGKNEDNGISVEELLQRITTEPGAESVRLFTVAYGQDADLDVLKRIAQQTNAAAYDSLDPARIDEVFAAVISNF